MVLSETRGLWLCGVMRVGLGSHRDLLGSSPEGSNKLMETHPRTHCLWRVGRTAKIQSRTVAPRLFGLRCHLRCQRMGVEPFSFLPQGPSEAGDLACQGEACQVRPHALVGRCPEDRWRSSGGSGSFYAARSSSEGVFLP